MTENVSFVNLNLGTTYAKPLYVRFDKIVQVDLYNETISVEGGMDYSPSSRAMKIITNYIKDHEMTGKNTIL